MFARLRLGLSLFTAAAFGYVVGSGPIAEWVVDIIHMLGVAWRSERTARGPNGSFPLLIAGFLIGQGVFLVIRQSAAGIRKQRAIKAERIAAWDPALLLATRFGLYCYMQHCARWAAEDPTARTQSLALFKIRGLGKLNETQGTLVTTQLLQRIASELRAAALPNATSRIRHWLMHFLPRPFAPTMGGMPAPRYPARWSGATFALAFRELEAVRAVSLARDLAAWINNELATIHAKDELSLAAIIAIGTPGVTGRSLANAATQSLEAGSNSLLTVVHDPTDVRATVISQMSDVGHKKIPMDRPESDADNPVSTTTLRERARNWTRTWGPAVGCFAATYLLLQFTSSKAPASAGYFTWPDNLSEVQIVDSSGSRTVRILRSNLPTQSAGGWTLSDGKIVQGNPADGPLTPCQVHISITNSTGHTYYVSSLDFVAVDANNRMLQFDPTRMLLLKDGIAGRWLGSGETWSGWLLLPRRDAPITELVFEPDRFTRISLRAQS